MDAITVYIIYYYTTEIYMQKIKYLIFIFIFELYTACMHNSACMCIYYLEVNLLSKVNGSIGSGAASTRVPGGGGAYKYT